MRRLGRSARFDGVDLGGDLVVGAEPGRRHQCQHGVGIVVDTEAGIFRADFLDRVPDALVGAGLGEVVAAVIGGDLFLGGDFGEQRGVAIEGGRVGEGLLHDEQTGAVLEAAIELGFDDRRVGGEQGIARIEDGVVRDRIGRWVVGEVGLPAAEGGKSCDVEIADALKGRGIHNRAAYSK